MKALHLLAWVSGTVAGILIILGFIAYLSGASFFGVNHVVNYFHVANSLLLISICCLIYRKQVAEKQD